MTTVYSFLVGFGGVAGGIIILTVVVWGLASGFLITNLSVELQQERAPALDGSGSDLDDFVTIIRLEKASWSAATLQSLKVEVFLLDKDVYKDGVIGAPSQDGHILEPDPDNRSLNAKGSLICKRDVLAIWTSQKGRSLNLAPNEKTQFASYCVVPSNATCEVIVTIMGERYLSGYVRPLFRWIMRLLYRRLIRTWPSVKNGLEPLRLRLGPSKVYWMASAISIPNDRKSGQTLPGGS